ncbi:MAG TPA: homogentisate 1,2-dioxygenase [Gammaproteobacteria bacterium]|nr:homogentisate 1,2-dioxygenase [Gammaproteobacteria bacterium]
MAESSVSTDPGLAYLSGFGNEHETEALADALPIGQFNPQQCPYGLYAEQISTAAFTAPRVSNRRTWMYRTQPSVCQGKFKQISKGNLCTAPITGVVCPINPLRWDPLSLTEKPQDFVDGLITMVANGDPRQQQGLAVHMYVANKDMQDRFFYSADGELLIVPQSGSLGLDTELGRLWLGPGEIAVIPRGIKFRVRLFDGSSQGYVCENYGAPFELPERGPVGANGFANDRDFLYPVAHYEDTAGQYQLTAKFCGQLFEAEIDHSPLNVVAWTGNSAPYKYDLARFNVINTVSFDHMDPSIFTVMTSPSDTPGTANVDFVIFPPRWMVAEHTFRPPWYHRNIMSEFMGLIKGQYDAKKSGFKPGGMSLHNCMTPHGPDFATHDQASKVELTPEYQSESLAFMVESRYPMVPSEFAMNSPLLQQDYTQCWDGLGSRFKGD